MTYIGDVTPGGSPATRELDQLRITKLAVDPEYSNNCYLLQCRSSKEQLLIDAADEADRLLQLIGDAGLATVVTTHQHWDHHRALADVVTATSARTVAGTADAAAITEQTKVEITHPVSDGDTIQVGEVALEVISLVGHTPGSIALLYRDPHGIPHLWTGDSLFPGGVGNTFGDAAAFKQLLHDVRTKIFDQLPDETWFYPGHGNDSTLGAERPSLDDWEERGW